jgi:glycyl-tRNA synthetase beta chain
VSKVLIFEIGTEEIPSEPLYGALEQMDVLARRLLDDARLSYGDVEVAGTPRRLGVAVAGLADAQENLESRVKGPPAKQAYDEEGRPTKAAEGFARSRGLSVDDLEVEEEGGAEYVFATVKEKGRPASEVLPGLLAELAGSIEWPKSMRWGSGTTRFTRPVRWLVALLDDEILPVTFAGLEADRVTRGHRFVSPPFIELDFAKNYGKAMAAGRVVVDPGQRGELIRTGIRAFADDDGVEVVVHDKTFREVVNLAEWPSVAMGRFDEEVLEVPRDVLETAMESHQRYFPVQDADAKLVAAFVVVHDGDPSRTEEIVAGHERVLRARLADAAFFYREDTTRPLEEFVPMLEDIVFQERLGTVGARVERIEALAGALCGQMGASPDVVAWSERAAHLCKADLVTSMVVEFPTLQGVMGRHYALAAGEASEVAGAIEEHYLPRHAGDDLPVTEAGAAVSIADKLDTIVGIFAIGMAPTGSADPYALRRSALGILRIIIERDMSVALDDAIAAALEGYDGVIEGLHKQDTGRAVKEFVLGRMETILKDRGHAYDSVEAILASAGDDPADAVRRAEALTAVRRSKAIADLSVAFTRAQNLSRPELGVETDASLMGDEERALLKAMESAEAEVNAAMSAGDYDRVLELLRGLRAPIDAFFEEVLVMDEDEALRDNRLRLLNRFVVLFSQYADFSALVD